MTSTKFSSWISRDLGDNRDRAADSRVGEDMAGIGMVPFSDPRGRPLFIYWSNDRSRIGTAL